jgi:hypothetical protein
MSARPSADERPAGCSGAGRAPGRPLTSHGQLRVAVPAEHSPVLTSSALLEGRKRSRPPGQLCNQPACPNSVHASQLEDNSKLAFATREKFHGRITERRRLGK